MKLNKFQSFLSKTYTKITDVKARYKLYLTKKHNSFITVYSK